MYAQLFCMCCQNAWKSKTLWSSLWKLNKAPLSMWPCLRGKRIYMEKEVKKDKINWKIKEQIIFMQNSITCHIYKVERVHQMGFLLRIWTKSTHYQVSRGKDVIKSPLCKNANTFPKPFFSLIKPRVSIEWDHLTVNCRCPISFIDVAVILAFA